MDQTFFFLLPDEQQLKAGMSQICATALLQAMMHHAI